MYHDPYKAFDTVDHDILLQKLEKYGVIGLEHTWFFSYLKNRRQLCRVNGVASNMEEIKCGVPQGSCLGPLLFLIYINDLPFALKNSEVTMYADDTSISYSSKNIDDLNETLNSDLDSLKQWLEGNKLSLNVIKTQAMVIGSRPNIKKISDKLVPTPKYLGVPLDKHLVWDEHTKALRSKISRSLGFLKYAKKLLPKYTLSEMYRGIVEPHFRYCCSVWGGCGDSRLSMLQKLQNRAARIVTNSSYDTPAANLIKELKWPTVHDMIKQETATIVFKSINGLAPTYLSTLFTRNSAREIVNLRNRETDLLTPRMKTSNDQKAFSFRGAKVWNELKHEVKLAPSLSTFKCRLKCK